MVSPRFLRILWVICVLKRERKIQAPKYIKELVKILKSKKSTNILILKVRPLTWITNYLILCSGNSSIQRRVIREAVEENYRKRRLLSVEEDREEKWLLLDYGDFILHIFDEETRKFYNLERLWKDALKVKIVNN